LLTTRRPIVAFLKKVHSRPRRPPHPVFFHNVNKNSPNLAHSNGPAISCTQAVHSRHSHRIQSSRPHRGGPTKRSQAARKQKQQRSSSVPMEMADTKLSVRDADVADKRVLVRVDFNVPLKEVAAAAGLPVVAVASSNRILAALPTIRLLRQAGARSIVLMSHLGRPGGKPTPSLSMRPVAEKLAELLAPEEITVTFVPGPCDSAEVAAACRGAAAGALLLLENLRFHAEEEGQGTDANTGTKLVPPAEKVASFRAALSELGDVFVNDAFGCAHRAHSSMVGVELPCRAAGLLMHRELEAFGAVMRTPARPLLAVLGGAKVSDKLQLIENMLGTVDELIVGGGMAFTFRRVLDGTPIGASLYDEAGAALVPRLMARARERGVRIHLPVDWVAAERYAADAAHRVVGAGAAQAAGGAGGVGRGGRGGGVGCRRAGSGSTTALRPARRSRRWCSARTPWSGTGRWGCASGRRSRRGRDGCWRRWWRQAVGG
jgi:phosphoglycerate kinase